MDGQCTWSYCTPRHYTFYFICRTHDNFIECRYLENNKEEDISLTVFFSLYGINIFTHLLIDSFNAYGTGLFEPFSDERISLHTIFVIDPFFSFWPFVAFLFLLWLKPYHPARKLWAKAGIVLSTLYLLYTGINKLMIDKDVRQNIQNQHISAKDYFITPTPLNSWLWFIVIKGNKGYYTAYRSVFDSHKEIDFSYIPQNDSLLNTSQNKDEIELLKKILSGILYSRKAAG